MLCSHGHPLTQLPGKPRTPDNPAEHSSSFLRVTEEGTILAPCPLDSRHFWSVPGQSQSLGPPKRICVGLPQFSSPCYYPQGGLPCQLPETPLSRSPRPPCPGFALGALPSSEWTCPTRPGLGAPSPAMMHKHPDSSSSICTSQYLDSKGSYLLYDAHSIPNLDSHLQKLD